MQGSEFQCRWFLGVGKSTPLMEDSFTSVVYNASSGLSHWTSPFLNILICHMKKNPRWLAVPQLVVLKLYLWGILLDYCATFLHVKVDKSLGDTRKTVKCGGALVENQAEDMGSNTDESYFALLGKKKIELS